MNKVLLIVFIIATCSLVFGFSLFGKSHELELTIPIEGMKGRFGKCHIDVLDLEDTIIGSAHRYAYIAKDHYSLKMKVKIRQEVEDYDLLRVKVTFKNQEHIYSLYQLQDRMIVKILGQDEFIKGTPINYHIIVQNQRTNEPIQNAQVSIALKADDKESIVFTGSTDRSGTCNTDFIVPDSIGSADLHFEIISDIGKDTYDANIKLLSGNLTYLVTDKPIYQPGQTIHIRTLTLRKPDLVSVSRKALTFEVEDSKGNRVFK
jgi:hypothetical protein